MPSLAKATKYGIDLHSKMNIEKLHQGTYQAIYQKILYLEQNSVRVFKNCLRICHGALSRQGARCCVQRVQQITLGGFVVIGFPTKNIVSNFIVVYFKI